MRDFNQHPRPGFRAQTAQAATICAALRNLHKRKLQKRSQVSARRRTRRGVEKREVQATMMMAPRVRICPDRSLSPATAVQDGGQHLLHRPPPEMNICFDLSRCLFLDPPPASASNRHNLQW